MVNREPVLQEVGTSGSVGQARGAGRRLPCQSVQRSVVLSPEPEESTKDERDPFQERLVWQRIGVIGHPDERSAMPLADGPSCRDSNGRGRRVW